MLSSSSASISRSCVGSSSSCGAPAPTLARRPLLLLPPMGSSYSSESESTSHLRAAFNCVCNCGGCWEGLLVPHSTASSTASVPSALPLPAPGPAAAPPPGPAPAAGAEPAPSRAPDHARRHRAPPPFNPRQPCGVGPPIRPCPELRLPSLELLDRAALCTPREPQSTRKCPTHSVASCPKHKAKQNNTTAAAATTTAVAPTTCQ